MLFKKGLNNLMTKYETLIIFLFLMFVCGLAAYANEHRDSLLTGFMLYCYLFVGFGIVYLYLSYKYKNKH